ncbi:hypothetical protein CBL_10395 [Carabus blaptoides fortunei]
MVYDASDHRTYAYRESNGPERIQCERIVLLEPCRTGCPDERRLPSRRRTIRVRYLASDFSAYYMCVPAPNVVLVDTVLCWHADPNEDKCFSIRLRNDTTKTDQDIAEALGGGKRFAIYEAEVSFDMLALDTRDSEIERPRQACLQSDDEAQYDASHLLRTPSLLSFARCEFGSQRDMTFCIIRQSFTFDCLQLFHSIERKYLQNMIKIVL